MKAARKSDYEAMEGVLFHYSVLHDDSIVACGGLTATWPDNNTRAVAWGLLGGHVKILFPFIHKNVVHVMDMSPFRRIEAFVDPAFPPAVRWIKMLGFVCETPYKPFYFPDGTGAQEWVRIR